MVKKSLGVLFQSTELNLASGGDGLDFYTRWGHYVSRTSPVELLVFLKKIENLRYIWELLLKFCLCKPDHVLFAPLFDKITKKLILNVTMCRS